MLGVNERLARLCLQLSAGESQVLTMEKLAATAQQAIEQILELSLDSRRANANTVFIALYGTQTKGHQYINQAIQQGCTLLIAETNQRSLNNQISTIELPAPEVNDRQANTHSENTATQVLVYKLSSKLGGLAKSFYFNAQNEKDKQPSITAITGTNGKTSVASLIAQWISLLGERTASIGTLGVNQYQNGVFLKVADTINTTPDVLSLYSQLHKFSQQGITKVALEASSHGLAQNRLGDINVDCGVFTNLSQDHLDYHHSMPEYSAAKRRLLLSPNLKYIIINADDPAAQEWMQDIATNPLLQFLKVVFFSMSCLPQNTSLINLATQANELLHCCAKDIRYTNKGCEFTLESTWGHASISLPLIGKFNVANFLAAAAALLIQGYDFNQLIAQVKNLSGVAGRMELFRAPRVHSSMPNQKSNNKQPNANILVDYAHTPDALKQALIAARAHTKGELVCIFGCGGDRDKSKRAIMGQMAERYADKIVITQDNSRTESPISIVEDIQKGMTATEKSSPQKVKVQLDRKLAIQEAWANSQQNDLILIAGKGHETYMEINHQFIDYDERAFVSAMLGAKSISSQKVSKQVDLGGQL